MTSGSAGASAGSLSKRRSVFTGRSTSPRRPTTRRWRTATPGTSRLRARHSRIPAYAMGLTSSWFIRTLSWSARTMTSATTTITDVSLDLHGCPGGLSALHSCPSISVHDATSYRRGCPAGRDADGGPGGRAGRYALSFALRRQLPASQLVLGGWRPDRVRRDAHLDRALERQEVVADGESDRRAFGGYVPERSGLPG